jgi:hypothetical protein
MTSVPPPAPDDAQGTLPAGAGGRLLIRPISGGGTIGMAGARRHAHVERGDPHGLVLDAGEQLDDALAHDERGLVPTDGIARKPQCQWDRGRHRTSPVTHLEALSAPHESRCHTVPEAHVAALARELLQQGFGLLQVGGVKPFSEPAVNRCEQLVGFSTLALLLP